MGPCSRPSFPTPILSMRSLKMLVGPSLFFHFFFRYAEKFARSPPPSIRNTKHSLSLSCDYALLFWKRCIPIRTPILDRIRTPGLTLMVSCIIDRSSLRRISGKHIQGLWIAITPRLRIGIGITDREHEPLSYIHWIQSRYKGFDAKESALVVHRAFERLRFDT